MSINITRISRARKHIIYFQKLLKAQSCFALTETVDASAVEAHRQTSGDSPCSYISYLTHAVSRVLSDEKDLNGVPSIGLIPNIVYGGGVRPKIVIDAKTDLNQTIYSAVLPPVELMGLSDIDYEINRILSQDFNTASWTKGARILDILPKFIGWPLFVAVAGWSRYRINIIGTVSISSIGEYEGTSFIASGGTPITVNAGKIIPRVFIREGKLEIRPGWNITMVFDHRLIDGVRGAKLLHLLKRHIESGEGW